MLAGLPLTLDGRGCASDYAAALLNSLRAAVHRAGVRDDTPPAIAWAQSGAMALTGRSDGPPLMCPAPLASCVEGVRAAFLALTEAAPPLSLALPGVTTLGERAALSGLTRHGAIAPGGACHLLRAADGWLAINLTRPDDWQLVPAWLEGVALAIDDWHGLTLQIAAQRCERLIERAGLLGLAAAPLLPLSPLLPLLPCAAQDESWFRVVTEGLPRKPDQDRGAAPLVIDLSALWAGPLASHLLQLAGMRVVKVESRQRPDGARNGPPAFFDLMNHGKASVAFDFADPHDIARLRELLGRADIVIESARPRGLRQLGISAEELVATTPGLTWISITGYGRDAAHENRIAYGDDAGVAAGLSALLFEVMNESMNEPLFCGDAIADPLTGWHAALVALASRRSGCGRLISLALHDVVAHCLHHTLPATAEERRARWRDWSTRIDTAQVASPKARTAPGAARPLGADTAAILGELDIAC